MNNKAVFAGQGPNKSGPGAGVHTGWVSPKKHKYPTERMMGTRTTIRLHDGREIKINGYTLPHTGYDWISRFFNGNGVRDIQGANIVAGRYAYEAFCWHAEKKPNGGFSVYNRYNIYG